MKTAGLPNAKTIDEYDFSFHPHLDKQVVMELFDLDFVTKHENVVELFEASRAWEMPEPMDRLLLFFGCAR